MKTNQVVIVSKINPWLEGLSFDELAAYSSSPEADVNPVTVDIVAAQLLGFVAVCVSSLPGPYEASKAVGYAGYAKDREFKGTTYAQLGNVVVLPEFQGLGFGSKLVDKTFNAMKSLGKPIGAVANLLSAGIFNKLGFTYAGDVVSDSGLLKPFYTYDSGQ